MGSMGSMDLVWVTIGYGEVRKRSRMVWPYVIEMPPRARHRQAQAQVQAGQGRKARSGSRFARLPMCSCGCDDSELELGLISSLFT